MNIQVTKNLFLYILNLPDIFYQLNNSHVILMLDHFEVFPVKFFSWRLNFDSFSLLITELQFL